jgi:CRISPR/Cas system-associated exonuclease Cas4 (RecB family)
MDNLKYISVRQTISNLLDCIADIKKEDLSAEVSILAPNIQMCQSINRELLACGISYINIFIETPQQHFVRKSEIYIMQQGGMLDRSDIAAMLASLLHRQKGSFSYFKSVEEFSSYSQIFADTILNLRLNIKTEDMPSALKKLGIKGKELLMIFEGYMSEKGAQSDYADIVNFYQNNITESIVAFPDTITTLSKHELEALSSAHEIEWSGNSTTGAEIQLIKPLSMTHEIREILRDIIENRLPLDKTVVIIPNDYLTHFISEADEVGVPVKSDTGKSVVPKEGLILLAIFDVITSNYNFNELKKLFYLQGKYHCVKQLSRCGIAEGRAALQSALEKCKAESKTSNERRVKVCDAVLEDLQKISLLEKLKETPVDLTEKVFEIFNFGNNSQIQVILKRIAAEIGKSVLNQDLVAWSALFRRNLEAVRIPLQKNNHKKGSLLLTSELMPGVFDYLFCPGMTERQFPKKHKEGPILLDSDIATLNAATGGNLQDAALKNKRESGKLAYLLGSAVKRWTASIPAMDLLTGKEESITPYLLELIDKKRELIAINRLPEMFEKSITEHEYMLINLKLNPEEVVYYWQNKDSGAKKHIELNKRLWDKNSPGLIGDISSSKNKLNYDTFSPSQFAKLISCPFHWLLEKVYKVKPLDIPEDAKNISPMTTGTILHSILEEYINSKLAGKIKNSNDRAKLLNSQLDEKISELAKTLGSNALFFLKQHRAMLEKCLVNFIKYEDALPPEREPICPELTFGQAYRSCTYDDPVSIDIDGVKFKLNGSIDRFDKDSETGYIIDYKTSSNKKYKIETLCSLSAMQPLLYSAALENMKEGTEVDKIKAGFIALKAGSKEYIAEYNEEAKEYLSEVISHIFELFSSGWFPINTEPIAGDEPCRYCDFTAICGQHKNMIADKHWKKASSLNPALQPIVEAFEGFRKENV